MTNFYSKTWRLKNLWKITTKDGKSVGFVKNKAQEIVEQTRKKLKAERGNVRLIILKGRQLGITTYACISNLDEAMMRKNVSCVITAHEREKMQKIFRKVAYAYEHFPKQNIRLSDGKLFVKRTTKRKNVNQLFFKENNSSIEILLDSRSGTSQILHITEIAFKHDAREMMAGTIPTLPENGELIIETTANGVGNYFHELREENYNNQNGAFYCLFLGWRLADEYRKPLIDGEVLNIPAELRHLNNPMIDGTILTDEQKKRYVETYKMLKREMFQEYPSTPEEAFLNTGDPVFDLNIVKSFARLPFQIDSEFPALRIYNPPEFKYCFFGVDTAEGGSNGDFSSIKVRDEKLRLLADFYDHYEPDELCKIIDRLIKLGYIGRLGIERNNTGLATITQAKNYQWYSLIYQEKTIDKKTNRVTQKVGWHTNAKTRPVLLSDFIQLIRNDEIPQIDERSRHEMYTFIYNEKKRPEASKGNHDDAIMSDAICCYMRNFPVFINKSSDIY